MNPDEVFGLDSTRDLLLSLFPAQQHANRSLQTMASLLEDFTRAGTLHAHLEAVVALYTWLRRPDDRLPELCPAAGLFAGTGSEWRRERVWLSILECSPELRDRYHAGIAAILDETDAISLFAQAGLPTDRGLLSETFDRFFNIVLPALLAKKGFRPSCWSGCSRRRRKWTVFRRDSGATERACGSNRSRRHP